ncbi:hypothetical protein EJ06DRAFT_553639 [Trichodelitschia bisporula]|uniref:Uncharacterized protein n=1 Tax=Trichodelitschia bisporula TaxID=703511 RepID=A0A6G1I938_9PEZI|nr:hypothetical protein EJ06DRAFT_553639 [Trichodelitschia bisporula]
MKRSTKRKYSDFTIGSNPRQYNILSIPLADVDYRPSFLNGQPDGPYTVREVPRSKSKQWGPPDVAAIRANTERHLIHNNEALLRTHHPSLAFRNKVYIITERSGSRRFWAVDESDEPCALKVAGTDVHIIPGSHLVTDSPFYFPLHDIEPIEDPLSGPLNPRRFFGHEDLEIIRDTFPAAVGAQVYISGYVVILYSSKKVLFREVNNRGVCPFIGQLRVRYSVADFKPAPHKANSPAAVGLRLSYNDYSEDPNGKETKLITVPSHAYAKTAGEKDTLHRAVIDHMNRLKKKFSKIANRDLPQGPPTSSVGKKVDIRCKGGKRVDVAGGAGKPKININIGKPSVKMGRIDETFDKNLNLLRPFPFSYEHDISVVKGDDLPKLYLPTGAITSLRPWAPNYSTVLDGAPCFLANMNVHPEMRSFDKPEQAIAEGTCYIWDRETHIQSASLLWRTEDSPRGCEDNSPSVLCCSQEGTAFTYAVLFKNYVTGTIHKRESEPRTLKTRLCRFFKRKTAGGAIQGGFLLPDFIRETKIDCQTAPRKFAPLQVPT